MNHPFWPHRTAIEADQWDKLERLQRLLLSRNPFYIHKWREAGLAEGVRGLDEFVRAAPFTTKPELLEDQEQHPPYGSRLTFPLEEYTRFHQTSGTTRGPLRCLDTPASWNWVVQNWLHVFSAAGVTRRSSVFFAFSFGPFLGFWSAIEAAEQMGCLCIPGGGMSSMARLHAMRENGITVLCCTPTYALRLAEVARTEGFPLDHLAIEAIIVAGEPGGSIPSTRRRLEEAWVGAHLFDHHGMTEVGPVSFQTVDHPDVLHVIESSYFAEVIHPETGLPVAEGECGELVLTTLGRDALPLLRYRTGDWVQPSWQGAAVYGRDELALVGGILGRVDDMVMIRGVNLYPTAIEEIVRSFAGVEEFRVNVHENQALAEIEIEVESAAGQDAEHLSRDLASALRSAFHLRIPVKIVPPGVLPRDEMKARRWVKNPKGAS